MRFINQQIIIITFMIAGLSGIDFSGNAVLQYQYFPDSPLLEIQSGSSYSLSLKPEFYHEWNDGYQNLFFVPFYRYDEVDVERTHFDIRELYWSYIANTWEIKTGIAQIFWGVTESQHLVDIINQTDFVEGIDGEKKLGQPMLDLTLINDWGVLDLILLPGFRERTFAGKEGRLRFPFIIDVDHPIYQADDGDENIDFAARYSHYIQNVDFAFSYFYGNSREPRYTLLPENQVEMIITPVYDLINQFGFELQYTSENGWLWEVESIVRENRGNQFFSFTGGYEYTFSNVNGKGLDIGILTEYLYDDRDLEDFAPNPFDNHLFAGMRLAFNDVQSTDLLAGAMINNDNSSVFYTVEGSRRLGESIKLILEIRAFSNIPEDDFFYGFRNDNHAKLDLEWYF